VPLQKAAGLLLATALLLPFNGCGNGLASVSGTVTLDGQPLRGGNGVRGTVYFQPAAGGSSAVGNLDEMGRYDLSTGSKEGAAPGDYLVTCSVAQIIPSKEPGGTPSGRRITDSKYANAKTSGFRFTVQKGDNEFDISLESPRGAASARQN
jgi:hypothetical protein